MGPSTSRRPSQDGTGGVKGEAVKGSFLVGLKVVSTRFIQPLLARVVVVYYPKNGNGKGLL